MSDLLQESSQEDAVEVTIFDRAYRLRKTADPGYLKRVAGMVDERMKLVHGADRTRPAGDLAVLAALQLAHELSEAQSERTQLELKLNQRARDLEQTLDAKLRELGV
ncbi:MAG: cell division protein ZapA [bacterium]|nr:cell division protein ZapA [bacterium]